MNDQRELIHGGPPRQGRATRPREPRPLLRWRWSVHRDGRPKRYESDHAGTLLASTSREALEEVLRQERVHLDTVAIRLDKPQRLHHWLTGGWATLTNSMGDTVTVLVVVTDPLRGDPLREGDAPRGEGQES
jgi:hypothetical protein